MYSVLLTLCETFSDMCALHIISGRIELEGGVMWLKALTQYSGPPLAPNEDMYDEWPCKKNKEKQKNNSMYGLALSFSVWLWPEAKNYCRGFVYLINTIQ